MSEKDNGTLNAPTRMHVSKFLDVWLNGSAKEEIGDTTYARYEALIKNYIVPHIGGYQMARLEPHHIHKFYTSLEKSEVGSRTR